MYEDIIQFIKTSLAENDVGYAISADAFSHASGSVALLDRYAAESGMDPERISFISYFVKSHSNKPLMHVSDSPDELILLMEADLLDETGSLSIVWDCLVEGMREEPEYLKAYRHVRAYSGKMREENPMVHRKAREIWASKQVLVRDFIESLERALYFTE